MRSFTRAVATLCACALATASATAAPVTLHHQGRLLDPLGVPLNGTHTLIAALVDASGVTQWTGTFNPALSDGFYTVALTPDANTLLDPALTLVLSVDGAELAREPLATVPHAATADTLTGLDPAELVLYGHTRVLQLSFDEGAGAVAGDRSGVGPAGTLGVSPMTAPTWTAGRRGHALSFDGVGNCVRVPNDPANQFRDGFTFMAWVNPTGGDPDGGAIVSKHFTHNNRSWHLYQAANEHGEVFMAAPDNTAFVVQTVAPLPAGVWTHLAGRYDPGAGELSIWVNGVKDNVAAIGAQRVMATSLAVTVGCFHNSSNDSVFRGFFTGTLDEIAVIPYPIPDADVTAIAQGYR